MVSTLRVVTVEPDGSDGTELGAAMREDDTITFTGSDVVAATFATLARVAGGDTKAWDFVARDGWSNSHLMFVPDAATAEAPVAAARGRTGEVAANFDPAQPRNDHGEWAHLPATSALHDFEDLQKLYGEEHDESTFGDNGRVFTWANADMSIAFEAPDGKFEVLADMGPDGARELATLLQWAVDTDPAAYEGRKAHDNGLLDWDELHDGTLVGFDDVGDVRLGVPDGSGKLNEVDLGADEAQELVDALHEQADRADEILDAQ